LDSWLDEGLEAALVLVRVCHGRMLRDE
jgi:hypothetical protein